MRGEGGAVRGEGDAGAAARVATLAELAATFLRPGAPESPVEPADLVALRATLDAAAAELVAALDGAGGGSFVLTKELLGALLDCERHAATLLAGRSLPGDLDAMARGVLFEALVRDHVTRSLAGRVLPAGGSELAALAAGLVAAELPDHPDDPVRARALASGTEGPGAGGAAAAELGDELGGALAALLAGWPELDERWWPHAEDPAKVAVGGGRVVLSGRYDVVLGGAPTPFPLVVVELKHGRLRDAYVEEQRFYALLAALRDRRAPAAVTTCCATPLGAELAADAVDLALLEGAADRVARALGVAARIVRGEQPVERAGWRCGRCADRDRCPSYRAPEEPGPAGAGLAP